MWLGWTLWRALRLDDALGRLLPEGREAVPWATMAAVLVLACLCEPSSELHIAETWYRGTALEDLLALPAPLVTRPNAQRRRRQRGASPCGDFACAICDATRPMTAANASMRLRLSTSVTHRPVSVSSVSAYRTSSASVAERYV